MSRRELAQVTSILSSAANKRIARIEKAGVTSPAVANLKRHDGKFSVKGKNTNQLRSEFARARNFMQNATSSVSGAKASAKQIEKNLGLGETVKKVSKAMPSYLKKEHKRLVQKRERLNKTLEKRRAQGKKPTKNMIKREQALKRAEKSLAEKVMKGTKTQRKAFMEYLYSADRDKFLSKFWETYNKWLETPEGKRWESQYLASGDKSMAYDMQKKIMGEFISGESESDIFQEATELSEEEYITRLEGEEDEIEDWGLFL
jgi:translation initiation factor 2 beta subunit (eIF-2beta)/eIF-5